jgi:lipopolysaccharide biosynthesis glycosyltransferase
MNLVFSFDEGYISTFKVFLYSIYENNQNEPINLFLLHYDMEEEALVDLEKTIKGYNFKFYPINCRKFLERSEDITINRYYTIEMYLWLYAPYVLPEEVDRALYLDPDIINLNNMRRFYDLDFDEHLFIAMDYEIKNKIVQPFNNLRLGTFSAEHYFNAGVVLMNIEKLRHERAPEEISEAVVENKAVLILPDQDIFNYLYTGKIKNADWELYNLDPRLYQFFQLIKPDTYNKKWVEDEVIFIHYGGKHKPWQEREKYKMDLGDYYFQYEEQLNQITLESSVEN